MRNSGKIAFGALMLMVLFLTYLEASEPEPINWSPSYLETDKIPLGTFVFYESWKDNTVSNIENVNIPPFEFLNHEAEGTYFFLNNYLDIDKSELAKLLDWVGEGNTVFLSANAFGEDLLDTLKLETSTRIPGTDLTSQPYINLVHPDLQQQKPYLFEQEAPLVYFSKIDTTTQTVLGVGNIKTFAEPSEAYPIFLKSPFGKGNIFIHSFPEAFSNYFMLSKTNFTYAEKVMSYINTENNFYWDRYYKTGKTFYSSPLYILLRNKPLKWAYYFLLIGSLLFIVFEGKRKQRPVPVKTPLKNQTLEYSKTIADLYLEQKKYKDLALKKIEHFNDYIRQHYRIDTSVKNEKFYQDLAEKTGHTEEETKTLYNTFNSILNKSEITKSELQELNDLIESFK